MSPIKGRWSGTRFRYDCSCCGKEYVQDVAEINPPAVCPRCYFGGRQNRKGKRAYKGRSRVKQYSIDAKEF